MSGYEIREIPIKGRALFATRDFKADELIFSEIPWISCQFSWNKIYSYKACDYCMRPLETAEQNAIRLSGIDKLELPYKTCCNITPEKHVECYQCGEMYCSQSCLETAKLIYHDVICPGTTDVDENNPFKALEAAWLKMHYPPETCSINLLVRILAKVKGSDNKALLLDELQKFASQLINKDAKIAHKMLGEDFKHQLQILYDLITRAIPKQEVEGLLSEEGFRTLFAIIATNAQGIGTSSFAAWVNNVEKLELPEDKKKELDDFIDQTYEQFDESVGTFLNCDGSGLYSLQSTMNHSCSPNAQCTFPNSDHTLVVEALRDIKAGEEICISYLGGECALAQSRHSRQKYLAQYYLFHCTCEKCELQSGDPDVTSEEESDDEMD